MRVFVIGTGRCGTVTLSKALALQFSYSVGHESRTTLFKDRLCYPDNHIEVDNRLSWFTGLLREIYDPQETVFVHMRRDAHAVAMSYALRYRPGGLLHAFMHGIIQTTPGNATHEDRVHTSLLMVEAIQSQCELFLQSVPMAVTIDLEQPRDGIRLLCEYVHLQKYEDTFLDAMGQVHNASRPL